MSFALNEIEATAKRATRGAGYTWGQAEEASKATRWLCEKGSDGAGVLARLLEQDLASDPILHSPRQIEASWQGSEDLCPLVAGPFLSDCAHLLKSGSIKMRDVALPELLLPFAAAAARTLGCSLIVDCDGLQVVTDGVNLASPDAIPVRARSVTVSKGDAPVPYRQQCTRVEPDPEDWATLTGFAHRTFAPASDESRLLGAGAGLSDND